MKNILVALCVISLVLLACGPGKDTAKQQQAQDTVSFAGPDKSVPPEMGGPGFEQIAEEQGWQTSKDYFRYKSPNVQKGGRFTYALADFPTTLRPEGKDSNSTVNSMIKGHMYERLLGLDIDFELAPSLASHWKIGEDKQTFWFRIDPRAYWSDGKPVCAEDVLYTHRLMVDKDILAPYANILFAKYEEPEVVSKYIVKVKAKELNWRLFLYFGAMTDIYPAHILKKYTGKEFLKAFHFNFMPNTGPYMVREADIKKGQSLTLTRRKDYWDKENSLYGSNFDKIKIKIVRDERLHFEKFKKGELDLYVVGRAQWWKEECNFDSVQRGIIQKRKVYTKIPQGFQGLAMNMKKAPFDDQRVRLAMAYLFNRQKLIEKLFYNEYLHMDSYYPNSAYANPENPIRRYDPDKALTLLAEAGYKDKNDKGVLVDEKGQPLEFDIMIVQSWNRIMTVIQEDYKQAGVKMNIKFGTPATISQLTLEKKFKITWQAWGAAAFPNPEASWGSELADLPNNNNICGVKSERIDEIAKEYSVCYEQKERERLIQEVDGILMEQVPYALGWYGPFTRVLYWNKFGQPKSYLSRRGDWRGISSLWWYDPQKDQAMEATMKDKNIKLPVGETMVTFWEDFDQKRKDNPDQSAQAVWDSM